MRTVFIHFVAQLTIMLVITFYYLHLDMSKEKLMRFDGDEYWDDYDREMCDNMEMDKTWTYHDSLCISFIVGFENVRVEVISWSPPVVIYRGIFSEIQVKNYLNVVEEQSLEPQKVVDVNGEVSVSNIRQAKGAYTPAHQFPAIQNLVNTASRLITSINFAISEDILALTYTKGGHFAIHYDYLEYEEALDNNGNRMATFIMVLHKPISGGGTIFPSLEAVVRPEAGDAILWFNCKRNGKLEEYSAHGGCPINEGKKTIATIWIQIHGQTLLEEYFGDESFNAKVFLPTGLF